MWKFTSEGLSPAQITLSVVSTCPCPIIDFTADYSFRGLRYGLLSTFSFFPPPLPFHASIKLQRMINVSQ